jgi:hypothetical protein
VKSGDAHFRGPGGELDAVAQLFHALDLANVLPTLGKRTAAGQSESQHPHRDASSEPFHFIPPGRREKAKIKQARILFACGRSS